MPRRSIFTYGSLMFPQVWQRVVRGRYAHAPATLDGHARYAVRGASYPGMVAQDDASVAGVVYFDVDERDVAALDAFEGSDYRRVTVAARLPDGICLPVDTYLFINRPDLLAQDWTPDNFALQAFLETYCS